MAWYRTGTISLTNGSTTVAGTGTAWLTGAAIGEALWAPDGRIYEIANITSDTVLVLGTAYQGTTAASQVYQIVPSQSYIRDLAAQAAALVANYASFVNDAGAGRFGDGTLLEPGIRFTADLDTGLRRVSANTLALVTGGVDRLTVGSSGAVTFALNPVLSAGTANGVPYLDGSKALTSGSALVFDGTNLGVGTTSPSSYGNIVSYKVGGSSWLAAISGTSQLYAGVTAGGIPSVQSNGDLMFAAGAGFNEQMRLNATGLGIGTTTPLSKLHASQYGGVAATVDRRGDFGQSFQLVRDGVTGSAGFGLASNSQLGVYVDGTERMRLTSTGLGIGTSSPGYKLDVRGDVRATYASDSTGVLLTNNGSGNGRIEFLQSDGSGRYRITANGDDNLTVSTIYNGVWADALVIDRAGRNLGLGVTPSAWSTGKAIEVGATGNAIWANAGYTALLQNVIFSSGAYRYVRTESAARLDLENNNFKFYTAPSGTAGAAISFTQAMTLDEQGRLLVGTTSGVDRLTVSGNMAFDSAQSYVYSTGGSGGSVNSGLFLDGSGSTLRMLTGNTERARIDASGNFVVGGTSAYATANKNLEINGTGDAAFNVSVGGTNIGYLYASDGSAVVGSRQNVPLVFNTNNTERARIDANGNLGVGVIPAAWGNGSSVQGSGWSLSTLLGFDQSGFYTNARQTAYGSYNANWVYRGAAVATGYAQTTGAHRWLSAASGTAGASIVWTERMTLNDSGNLGLGITPSGWNIGGVLQLAGTPAISSVNGADITFNAYWDGAWKYSNATYFPLLYSQNGSYGSHSWHVAAKGAAGSAISFTQAMTLEAGGNLVVGGTSALGTVSNRGNVTVNGASQAIYALGIGGSLKGYMLHAGSDLWISNEATGATLFYVGGTERARIDADGHLLVGATSASRHWLSKNNAAGYSVTLNNPNANPLGVQIYHDSDLNAAGNQFLDCQGGTQVRMQVRSNGGIANYSANNANLSDRREKTNIEPAKSYLDVICAIPVVSFDYIDQSPDDPGKTLGVIAQDVEAVAPELVSESNWGSVDQPKMRKSIYQTDLQYALMKSIQELKAELDALRAELAALKSA